MENYRSKVNELVWFLIQEEQNLIAGYKRENSEGLLRAKVPIGLRELSTGAAAPANIVDLVPYAYLLAENLKLDPRGLYLEHSASWTGVDRSFGDPGAAEPGDEILTGWCQMRLHVMYGRTVLAALSSAKRRVTTRVDLGDPTAKALENWEQGWNLKREFEFQPKDPAMVPEEQTRAIEKRVDIRLVQMLLRGMSENFRVALLNDALDRVSGAKALLDAFRWMGMPDTSQTDEYLQSMLYGNQSLPDRNIIEAAYERALLAPETQRPNPREAIEADAQAKAEALRGLFHGHLSRIADGDKEIVGFVQDTLLTLRIAEGYITWVPGGFVAGKSVVSWRKPSKDGQALGHLIEGYAYDTDGYTDQGQEVDGSSRWYRLTIDGQYGWAHSSSGMYIVTENGTFEAAAGASSYLRPTEEDVPEEDVPEEDVPEEDVPSYDLTEGRAYKTNGYTDQGQEVDGSSRWYRLADADPAEWVHSSSGMYSVGWPSEAPLTLASLEFDPDTIRGDESLCEGRVTLSGPAPPRGAQIALFDDALVVVVPQNVTVPREEISATFAVERRRPGSWSTTDRAGPSDAGRTAGETATN